MSVKVCVCGCMYFLDSFFFLLISRLFVVAYLVSYQGKKEKVWIQVGGEWEALGGVVGGEIDQNVLYEKVYFQ